MIALTSTESTLPTAENAPFRIVVTLLPAMVAAFCAGALAAIYDGLADKEILEFASAVAAVALHSPDATGGLKTKEEIESFCAGFTRQEL